VRVAGLDVGSLPDRALAGLRAASAGFVFQQFFLAEHQKVLGNVADGLLYAGHRLAERRERAAAALVVGALAGLWPALRAARMSPTQALWSI